MTAPAGPTRAPRGADHRTVVALADALLNAVLTARIRIGFQHPDDVRDARHQLMRGFHALAALYDALPPEPPAAPAAGPR